MGADASKLPFDVIEAAVAVVGKAFYYKNAVRALFLRCGVTPGLYDRYRDETKYAIARHIFGELENGGESGRAVALEVISELCSIRSIADDNVDKVAAMKAIEELRRLATEAYITKAESEEHLEKRRSTEAARIATITRREIILRECKDEYVAQLSSTNQQQRGFALEKLFERLFDAFEITYRASYRSEAQQTDGAFRFESFDYLVETKWTQAEASLASLDSFRAKVSRMLSSTRGLFVSIAGFSEHVVSQFQMGSERNVILMSGEDLFLILEGRFSLADALELKTTRAAHDGSVFVRLRDCM